MNCVICNTSLLSFSHGHPGRSSLSNSSVPDRRGGGKRHLPALAAGESAGVPVAEPGGTGWAGSLFAKHGGRVRGPAARSCDLRPAQRSVGLCPRTAPFLPLERVPTGTGSAGGGGWSGGLPARAVAASGHRDYPRDLRSGGSGVPGRRLGGVLCVSNHFFKECDLWKKEPL